ncbi:MAG: sensor histidine kinase [Peptostreptococcaceae bacterium]
MENKRINKGDYYKLFFIVYIAISIIYTAILKYQNNKILSSYPNLYNSIKSIEILSIVFVFVSILIMLSIMYSVRKNIVEFTNSIMNVMDNYIQGKSNINLQLNRDTLICKVQNKFKQLIEIMNNKNNRYLEEKDSIKTLISDISHQIKTPIANISMYNETLINRELDREKEIHFLKNMQNQVNKLEWLVQALIKMSRLETGIIELDMKKSRISDTIANAISGVYLKAQDKNIMLEIDIDEKLELYHDKKWTSEALFNIIENAIKYTNSNGKVQIKLEKLEMFTKINIIDSGIGIDEFEINNIFKRFYRSREVSELEGVGVGLYLAREIINKQSGYIKVTSKKGIGSTFSVYLNNV